MPKVKPSRDIQPLSSFRANAAGFIQQVRDTKQPLVLTQHGRSAAVVLDVEAYESLLEEVELLRDINVAEEEIQSGEGVPHDAAKAQLKKRLGL